MSIARDGEHPAVRGARLRSRPALTSLKTVRPDLVEVTRNASTLGYIEMVGAIFVVLEGDRYDHAVEILQTMSIEVAIESLSA